MRFLTSDEIVEGHDLVQQTSEVVKHDPVYLPAVVAGHATLP